MFVGTESRLLCGAALKKSINMWHIKHHYFTSHPRLNYYAIVPVSATMHQYSITTSHPPRKFVHC